MPSFEGLGAALKKLPAKSRETYLRELEAHQRKKAEDTEAKKGADKSTAAGLPTTTDIQGKRIARAKVVPGAVESQAGAQDRVNDNGEGVELLDRKREKPQTQEINSHVARNGVRLGVVGKVFGAIQNVTSAVWEQSNQGDPGEARSGSQKPAGSQQHIPKPSEKKATQDGQKSTTSQLPGQKRQENISSPSPEPSSVSNLFAVKSQDLGSKSWKSYLLYDQNIAYRERLSASKIQELERSGTVEVIYTDPSTHYRREGRNADGSPHFLLDWYGQVIPESSGFGYVWVGKDGKYEAEECSTEAANSSIIELRGLDAAIIKAFQLHRIRGKPHVLLVSDSLDAIWNLLYYEREVFYDSKFRLLYFQRLDPDRAETGSTYIRFYITWIRGHSGCAGNCAADGVAKSGSWNYYWACSKGLFDVPRKYPNRQELQEAAREADRVLAAAQMEAKRSGLDEEKVLANMAKSAKQATPVPSIVNGWATAGMVADPAAIKKGAHPKMNTGITKEMEEARVNASSPTNVSQGSEPVEQPAQQSNKRGRPEEADASNPENRAGPSELPSSKRARQAASSRDFAGIGGDAD